MKLRSHDYSTEAITMPDDKMHPLEKVAWVAVLGLLFWLALQNPFVLMGSWAVRPLVAACAPNHDPGLMNVKGQMRGWDMHANDSSTGRGPLPKLRSLHAPVDQVRHRKHAGLCDAHFRDKKIRDLPSCSDQLNSRAGFEPRSRPKGMLAPFGSPINFVPPQEAGFNWNQPSATWIADSPRHRET